MGLCLSPMTNHSGPINHRNRKNPPPKKKEDNKLEESIQERALAAAILFHQQMQNGGSGGGGSHVQFDRSSSLNYPKKQPPVPRSTSSRPRSATDNVLHPRQLLNQEVNLASLETDHLVLVHGGVFGAWCWYKTIALLQECGFQVTAIDLTGSGVNSVNTDSITSLSQYVKPLMDFLEKLADGEKVVLVGHDFGGTCISYAMELLPHRVSKSIFIAAAMLTNGQSTLDMFSQKDSSDDMMQQAQVFQYANGNNQCPTAIDLDKSLVKNLLFNQSPTKDIALATVSMRPIPFAPVLEKISLSETNYGSVRRFYIQTLEDNAIPISLQESMINQSPPEKVFRLKGADHSPFFSKPQALHKLLVEIAKIPST